MEENIYTDLAGVEDILERYVNPQNVIIYMQIFDFFIKDEFMQIFDYINKLITSESNLSELEITCLIRSYTAKQALLLLKEKYGIVLDIEEMDFKLLDILVILNKLEYLLNVDKEKARLLLDIINSRDTENEKLMGMLVEVGIDEMFLIEHLADVPYGFIDEYLDLYRKIIDEIDEPSEGDMIRAIEFNNLLSKISTISSEYNIKCLSLAKHLESYPSELLILEELNKIDFKIESNIDYIAIEFISAIMLSRMDIDSELVSIYKEDILPGLEIPLERQEEIFKLMSKYYMDIKQTN